MLADVNECNTNQHSCNTTTSVCLNNDGSYICKCKDGFTSDEDNNNCIGLWLDWIPFDNLINQPIKQHFASYFFLQNEN